MTRLTQATLAVLVALAVTASCQPQQVGSRFVKSEKVSSTGSTISITGTDSQALSGTKLEVTAGALDSDTTLTLEVGLTSLVTPESAAGPVAVWEPSGLVFTQPVKMTLPFKLQTGQTDADLAITVQEANGKRFRIARSALDVDAAAGLVSFWVTGFTSFQPTAGGRCMSNADCISTETCVSSVCTPMGGTGGGTGGGTASCTPVAETCDGVDNDCDGVVDDGATCASGQTCSSGACVANGTQCASARDCSPAQTCTNGYCVGGGTGGGSGGTGGGSAGTGGGSPGTGGGTASCGTCAAGETCWGGTCTLIACDPVRGCPTPLSCVNNSCQ